MSARQSVAVALPRVALRFGRITVRLKPPLPHPRTGDKRSTCRRAEAEIERTCAAPCACARGRGLIAARGQLCSRRLSGGPGRPGACAPARCRPSGPAGPVGRALQDPQPPKSWRGTGGGVQRRLKGHRAVPCAPPAGPTLCLQCAFSQSSVTRLRRGSQGDACVLPFPGVGSCLTRLLCLSGGVDESEELAFLLGYFIWGSSLLLLAARPPPQTVVHSSTLCMPPRD